MCVCIPPDTRISLFHRIFLFPHLLDEKKLVGFSSKRETTIHTFALKKNFFEAFSSSEVGGGGLIIYVSTRYYYIPVGSFVPMKHPANKVADAPMFGFT